MQYAHNWVHLAHNPQRFINKKCKKLSIKPQSLYTRKNTVFGVNNMEKSKIKIPPCLWAKQRWCWQRNSYDSRTVTSRVQEWHINEDKCAACIAARINYGDYSLHHPLTKLELTEECNPTK
jgi:hypothetical protein